MVFKHNYSLDSQTQQENVASSQSPKCKSTMTAMPYSHRITRSGKSFDCNMKPIGFGKSDKSRKLDKDAIKRRASFETSIPPWDRRKSFLSHSMISNDKLKVYRLSSSYSSYSSSSSYAYSSSSSPSSYSGSSKRIPSFCMSLSESQGFIWNQNLFYRSSARPSELFEMDTSSNHVSVGYPDHDRDDDEDICFKVDVIDIIVDEEQDECMFDTF